MRVLVVAVTVGSPGCVCVGAMTKDGRPVRLVEHGHGHFVAADHAPNVGALLDVSGRADAAASPPHLEDFIVDAWSLVTTVGLDDVDRCVREQARNISPAGPLLSTFNDCLRRDRRSLLVPEGSALPPSSVWFWVTDRWIRVGSDDDAVYAYVRTDDINGPTDEKPARVRVKAVDADSWRGRTIPPGTLTRFSLTRFWEDHEGRRGYWLQLSGVFSPAPA